MASSEAVINGLKAALRAAEAREATLQAALRVAEKREAILNEALREYADADSWHLGSDFEIGPGVAQGALERAYSAEVLA